MVVLPYSHAPAAPTRHADKIVETWHHQKSCVIPQVVECGKTPTHAAESVQPELCPRPGQVCWRQRKKTMPLCLEFRGKAVTAPRDRGHTKLGVCWAERGRQSPTPNAQVTPRGK